MRIIRGKEVITVTDNKKIMTSYQKTRGKEIERQQERIKKARKEAERSLSL